VRNSPDSAGDQIMAIMIMIRTWLSVKKFHPCVCPESLAKQRCYKFLNLCSLRMTRSLLIDSTCPVKTNGQRKLQRQTSQQVRKLKQARRKPKSHQERGNEWTKTGLHKTVNRGLHV
jgi:hypothetical protein